MASKREIDLDSKSLLNAVYIYTHTVLDNAALWNARELSP